MNRLGLDLVETRVTDAGLRTLARFRKLRSLQLARTRVGDAGMRHLAGLPLGCLSLAETRVTGRGFTDVALEDACYLHLDGCPVDDEGLRCVVQVRGVQVLYLSDTKITDAGLQWLAQLGDGCAVILWGTSITDEGLNGLRARKGKLAICAGATAVTEAGAADLKRACADCTICFACGGCRGYAKRRALARKGATKRGSRQESLEKEVEM